MMVLLTDEEYRALQFKRCEKCDGLKAKLVSGVEAAQLEFVKDLVNISKGGGISLEILNNALNKASDAVSKMCREL